MIRTPLFVTALVMLPFLSAPSTAQATCFGADFTEFESTKACAATLPAHALEPNDFCGSVRGRLVTARMIEEDRAAYMQIPWNERKFLSHPGNEPWPRPTCALISDVMLALTERRPVWHDCMGFEAAVDKADFAVRCVVSHVNRNAEFKPEFYRKGEIPIEFFYPKNCREIKKLIEISLRDSQGPDWAEPSEMHPEGIKLDDLNCEALRPFFDMVGVATSKQQEIFKQRRAEARARRAEAIRQGTYKSIEQQLEESFQLSMEVYARQANEQAASAQHPKDRIDASHIKRALIVHLQELYPEEVTEVGSLEGHLTHTTGGLKSRTNLVAGPVVHYGVKSVGQPDCIQPRKSATTCQVSLTLSAQTTYNQPGQRGALLDALAAGLASNTRTRVFDLELRHDGQQWRVAGDDEALTTFMILQPSGQARPAQGYTPEECVMLDSLGVKGAC